MLLVCSLKSIFHQSVLSKKALQCSWLTKVGTGAPELAPGNFWRQLLDGGVGRTEGDTSLLIPPKTPSIKAFATYTLPVRTLWQPFPFFSWKNNCWMRWKNASEMTAIPRLMRRINLALQRPPKKHSHCTLPALQGWFLSIWPDADACRIYQISGNNTTLTLIAMIL